MKQEQISSNTDSFIRIKLCKLKTKLGELSKEKYNSTGFWLDEECIFAKFRLDFSKINFAEKNNEV